jgi:hypothetical protein
VTCSYNSCAERERVIGVMAAHDSSMVSRSVFSVLASNLSQIRAIV